MTHTALHPTPGPLGRLVALILDGERPWGSLTISVERYGAVRLRLVVYPPGIDASSRRRVRAWRAWPVLGLLLGFGILMGGADGAPIESLLIAAGVVYAIGFVVLARVAGPARRDVREVWAVRVTNGGLTGDLGRCARVRRLAARLMEADRLLEAGETSVVDHEVVWAEVHDALGELCRSETVGRGRSGDAPR